MTTENTITEAPVAPSPEGQSAAWELPAEPTGDAPVDVTPVPEAPAATEVAESPEVTVPFNIPESLRPQEPETQGGLSPAEIEALQSEVVDLKKGQAETLRIQAQNKNATSIQELTQQYITLYNLDETTARFTATQVVNERQQGESNLAQAEMRGQVEVGRRNAAQHFASKNPGVDPSALINLDSPAAMEREAKWIVAWNATDKRVAAVEKARVPEQTFASGGQGDAVTSDNIDRLFVQYETEHPGNTSNPFEARYRRFLESQNQ